jgi:hypothetical protein
MANKLVNGTITPRGLFRDKYFLRGYSDYTRNAGWNTEYDNWYQGQQWQYERGRQYAAATAAQLPPKVKDYSGKTVLNNAGMREFSNLYHTNAIL